jgi:hypothetical protein
MQPTEKNDQPTAEPELGRQCDAIEKQLVEWNGSDDPERPCNWPLKKKLVTTILYGLTTMATAWASAMYVGQTKPTESPHPNPTSDTPQQSMTLPHTFTRAPKCP